MDSFEEAAQPTGPASIESAPQSLPMPGEAIPQPGPTITMDTPLEQVPEHLRGAFGQMQESQTAKLKNLEAGYTPKLQELAQGRKDLEYQRQLLLQQQQPPFSACRPDRDSELDAIVNLRLL